jgi:hypothetical protein
MDKIGKWLYLIGLLVAILSALFFQHDILTLVLLIVAILAGIFYANPDDASDIGLRYLVLYAVAGVFSGELIGLGDWLTKIFEAAVWFLGPYVLTVLMVRFFKKYFG